MCSDRNREVSAVGRNSVKALQQLLPEILISPLSLSSSILISPLSSCLTVLISPLPLCSTVLISPLPLCLTVPIKRSALLSFLNCTCVTETIEPTNKKCVQPSSIASVLWSTWERRDRRYRGFSQHPTLKLTGNCLCVSALLSMLFIIMFHASLPYIYLTEHGEATTDIFYFVGAFVLTLAGPIFGLGCGLGVCGFCCVDHRVQQAMSASDNEAFRNWACRQAKDGCRNPNCCWI